MTHHSPPNPENFGIRSETATSSRFSLANENIGSRDEFIRHPSGRIRLITYPTPSPAALSLRQELLDRSLILGTLQSSQSEAEQSFVIPLSARPIGYDAGQGVSGAFTYDDKQMFHDLGELLSAITKLGGSGFVIKGDIGRLVALVEFQRPNERRLYFVPGVEIMGKPMLPEIPPMQYYCERLNRQFGQRFAEVTRYFTQGFESHNT